MPLQTVIDNLILGEAADGEDRYLFLIDPATGNFAGAAGYFASRRYLECVDLVSDGYGPTLFLLLMQKAKRDGFLGVSPDLAKNSDEAKRMDARFYYDPPPPVRCIPNPDATHPEVFLNQIYYLTSEVIDEQSARRRADDYFAKVPIATIMSPLRALLLQASAPRPAGADLARQLLSRRSGG